jgi:DNA-binding CsgD family transcriptional regulator
MPEPLDVVSVSNLITQIYDCALEPSGWQKTISDLHILLGYSNAAMVLTELPSGGIASHITAGVPEPFLSTMQNYGDEVLKHWGGPFTMANLPLDEPAVLTRVNPTNSVYENRYYREWAEPQGLIDVLAIGLIRDVSMLGSIGMGRHQKAGPITDHDIASARIFVPHLQRAIAISRVFEMKSQQADMFGEVLDTISTPAIIVDDCLTVLYANVAAAAILARGDPLCQMAGRLRISKCNSKISLPESITDAKNIFRARAGTGAGLALKDAAGHVYMLHVLPLKNSRFGQNFSERSQLVLFLAGYLRPDKMNRTAAAKAYDFTKAEARIFHMIGSGASVASVAALLGIKASTVRTHLIHIFEKTGLHRQSDIVRLCNDLAGPANK